MIRTIGVYRKKIKMVSLLQKALVSAFFFIIVLIVVSFYR